MRRQDSNPFTDPCPEEVALARPPLVRVICQVRFPLISSIQDQAFIGPFQEAIRKQYPTLRSARHQGFAISDKGIAKVDKEHIWKFSDRSKHWIVSLAPGFLALETTAYRSRSDFLARMEHLVNALITHFEPAEFDRLGVRYIDRIESPALERIEELIWPDILGVAYRQLRQQTNHFISESLFQLEAGQMRARWGFLPPQTTVEPLMIEPIDQHSWILDMDTFSTKPCEMDSTAVLKQLSKFTQSSYAFFRWVVTKEFLAFYQS